MQKMYCAEHISAQFVQETSGPVLSEYSLSPQSRPKVHIQAGLEKPRRTSEQEKQEKK